MENEKTFTEICLENSESETLDLESLGYGFGAFKDYNTGKYMIMFTSKYLKNNISEIKSCQNLEKIKDMMTKIEKSGILRRVQILLREKYSELNEKYPLIIGKYGESTDIRFETVESLCDFVKEKYGIIIDKEVWN